MSTNNEQCQINAEHALHHVMDIVCKYVQVEDLFNIALVCKSWSYAALRERSKRVYHLQRLSLPYQVDNLASRLHAIPSASLLFYDSSMGQLVQHDFEEELLEHFKAQLPNTKILVGVKDFCHLEYGRRCDILGLFLPSMENRIRIDVAYSNWVSQFGLINEDTLCDCIAEKLGLNVCEYPKSTLLLLENSHYWELYSRLMAQLGKRAQRNGKEITLASLFVKSIAVTGNCQSQKNYKGGWPIVILRISGPSVDSWSTFIHIKAQRDEIARKLRKLKEKVKRKRYNIGLVYMRKCYRQFDHFDHPCANGREMMSNLKCFFSEIQFTVFFKSYQGGCIPHNLRPNDDVPDRPNDDSPNRPNDDIPNRPNDDVPDRPNDDIPDRPNDDDIPDRLNDNIPHRPNTADRFDENDVFKEDFLQHLPDYVSIIIISCD